ncbi:MAG: hypothetical protein A2600_02960 [Candidatus Lambdaproteobacteria bacterium RIFOXYD1_FULL_56_27]|uniref:MobA-like NTP transferase domain-containing protein n=1 Tax=Candidatus Lambdaproteobacteria bacterium RIFOXYD2_FULL_56_26 TaxID=1817773 RepID=A0A1F6H311_9PROT|nr:MAG: hypothetical protein A2557_07025 [Candidatus Lambdaproteobacteria bacterium RIFOXYD2_FULL_56_26]OGH05355.1 MAG: hypothetical protein A2426_05350 [Candidatus Lambdaproteobacteria bacterium RIFOXYC1_FULL_56_13]OGH09197.1 MAG: hypothetical protein A2600_02960 [Candidatus Lambdaproteobacteria bacterium RIFOXYD1_FULL_56_27]
MSSPVELLILAAGVGSRYGGDKQLDGFGPAGESLMEYALFDAKKAGFSRVVFVIRKDLEEVLAAKVIRPYRSWFEIDYYFQEIKALPAGFEVPLGRTKPWGTGQAVLLAKDKIRHPFAVVNADDYYGPTGYHQMAKALAQLNPQNLDFLINAYRLDHTLSDEGTVSRGLLGAQGGQMSSLTECTKIGRNPSGVFDLTQEPPAPLDPLTPVSMNFWGFTPAVFGLLEQEFSQFLAQQSGDPKAEFYITSPIDRAVKEGRASVRLLECQEQWLGVTYPGDKPKVIEGLKKRHMEGQYPRHLAP